MEGRMSSVTPVRIRERLEDRARRILDEAVHVVGLRGYYGFSIKELADRCGLTAPGVLHHFPSKNLLLLALLEDRDLEDAQIFQPLLVRARAQPASLADVRQAVLAGVMHHGERPEIIRLVSVLRNEALYPDHPAHEHFARRSAATVAMLELLLKPHFDDASPIARRVLSLVIGLEELWLRADQGFDLAGEFEAGLAQILP